MQFEELVDLESCKDLRAHPSAQVNTPRPGDLQGPQLVPQGQCGYSLSRSVSQASTLSVVLWLQTRGGERQKRKTEGKKGTCYHAVLRAVGLEAQRPRGLASLFMPLFWHCGNNYLAFVLFSLNKNETAFSASYYVILFLSLLFGEEVRLYHSCFMKWSFFKSLCSNVQVTYEQVTTSDDKITDLKLIPSCRTQGTERPHWYLCLRLAPGAHYGFSLSVAARCKMTHVDRICAAHTVSVVFYILKGLIRNKTPYSRNYTMFPIININYILFLMPHSWEYKIGRVLTAYNEFWILGTFYI